MSLIITVVVVILVLVGTAAGLMLLLGRMSDLLADSDPN